MKIHTLPLGDYQTNTYIVENEGHCAIVDPGYEPETILAFLKKHALTADAILLTHGHFDHVGAVEKIVEETGCKLWMSERDWSQKNSPLTNYFYPIANCDFAEVQFCEEGEEISAAGLTFKTLETPGHTRGSVCYLCGDALFSGDTLFAGSCGRCDLRGGNFAQMMQSLKRLYDLPGNYHVLPGHDTLSTLEKERQGNIYMMQAVAGDKM